MHRSEFSRKRRYSAFISYSHADEHWAKWLQRAIEKFRIPWDLRRSRSVKNLRPVFRDEDEMPASTDLGANLKAKLEASLNLIVICSVHSRKSVWVNAEVAYFKQLGRADRIFLLVVDGTPFAERHDQDVNEECLVAALRFTVEKDGTYGIEANEPGFADVRAGKSKRPAIIKVVAGLLDTDFESLNKRARRQSMTRWAIASVAVVGVIGTFGWQRNVAQKARLTLLADGYWQEAIAVQEQEPLRALHLMSLATKTSPNSATFPSFIMGQAGALMRVNALIASADIKPQHAEFLEGGKYVAFISGSKRMMWDTASDAITSNPLIPVGAIEKIRASKDGEVIVTSSSNASYIVELATGEVTRIAALLPADQRVAAGQGRRHVVSWSSREVSVWQWSNGLQVGKTLDAKSLTHNHQWVADVDADIEGRQLLILTRLKDPIYEEMWTNLYLWDIVGEKVLWSATSGLDEIVDKSAFSTTLPDTYSVQFLSDGRHAVTWNCDSFHVLDLVSGREAAKGELSSAFPCYRSGMLEIEERDRVVFWSNKTAQVFDAETWGQIGQVMVHGYDIIGISRSADGEKLLSWGEDNAIRIWDVESGQQLGTPMMHRAPVQRARFSLQGDRILSWSEDGSTKVWLVGGDREFPRIELSRLRPDVARNRSDDYTNGVRDTPRYIATSHQSHLVDIWDVKLGRKLGPGVEVESKPCMAIVDPTGARVAIWRNCYEEDFEELGSVAMFDVETGTEVAQMGDLYMASFSQSGEFVAGWRRGKEHPIRILSSLTGKPVQMDIVFRQAPSYVLIDGRGTRMVSLTPDDREGALEAQLWNLEEGTRIGRTFRNVQGVWFNRDGSRALLWSDRLYGGDSRMNLRAWIVDTSTARTVGEKFGIDPNRYGEYEPLFTADGEHLLKKRESTTLLDVETGAVVQDFGAIASSAALDSSGKRLVSWDRSLVQVVETATRHKHCSHALGSAGVAFVHPSPNERHLVVRTVTGQIKVLDISGCKALGPPFDAFKEPSDIVTSSDGSIVVLLHRSTGRLWIWSVSLGEQIGAPLAHSDVKGARFNADSSLLLSWGNEEIRLWDTSTAKQLGQFVSGDSVEGAFFSAEDKEIIAWSWDSLFSWPLDGLFSLPEPIATDAVASLTGTLLTLDGKNIDVMTTEAWMKLRTAFERTVATHVHTCNSQNSPEVCTQLIPRLQ